MKYFLIILAVCILFCACSSRRADEGYYSYKENGILEEEFDLLIAPQMDYEEEIPYENQIKAIKNTADKQTVKLAKPQKKPVAAKVK